ncbi:MAG: putative pterin-4-alpha-carbinolamine dehydratase [Stictis urceolatum]|nr:putative pterin-4-alpha-carbinolamine dehydratase [Stictis urceolata]
MAPVFASAPSTHDKLGADIKSLLKDNGGMWELSGDGKAIEIGWEFGGFNKAWAFMNAVAQEAKDAKHHPEWSNTYNRVIVRWTTHQDRETKQSGLTPLDVRLAARTQELAREHGAKKALAVSSDSGTDGAKAQIDKLDGCSACRP